MDAAGWVVDENEEAHFIDICVKGKEKDDDRETRGESDRWACLPDLLLEEIFSYLSLKHRYYASLVCRNWYRVFYFPRVWSNFVFDDVTLTRTKYNYYLGWQYVLDHLRASMCLSTVGRNIRNLIIKPNVNFANLYDFMNILCWFIDHNQQTPDGIAATHIGENIRTLTFIFPCNMTDRNEVDRLQIFGTGGKLLSALKKLMGRLNSLQNLDLIDLMLEPNEAKFLLDEVCNKCVLTLKHLNLINATKTQYEILHAGVFLNLYDLHVSPQNLGDDLVELLGQTNLKHLHIVQNTYTTDEKFLLPISSTVWKKVRKMNPDLSVHLKVESDKKIELIWQEGAPVKTVLYNSPYIGVSISDLIKAIDFYKIELQTFGHFNLPRFYMPRPFFDRNDENLIMLVRQCENLSTLIITERISTATVLLIAYTGRNLKCLRVRGNAVILKCDWKKNPDWSDELYSWLRINSKSYRSVEKEVSQILGYNWRFLTDKEFKKLKFNIVDC